jgi:hypothetical protein
VNGVKGCVPVAQARHDLVEQHHRSDGGFEMRSHAISEGEETSSREQASTTSVAQMAMPSVEVHRAEWPS